MKFRPAFAAVAVVCLVGPARLSADEIIVWNNVLLNAVRTNSMSPLPTSRVSAAMNTAMYDAVNSIARTHQPYHVNMTADPGTSRQAAAAQAAHRVLSGMVPASQASYNAALANSLSSVPDGAGKTAGIALGNTVGTAILALRANDGASAVVPYTPGSASGDWRPTPPANAAAAAPQWGSITPWASSPTQFRNPDGPPALDSPEFTAAFNQVKEIGSATSATRTQVQSDIAQYWAGGATGTSTPPGHWNKIAQTVAESQGNTLEKNARLFALVGIAQADALIACWDNKYHYNDWRPVTAIRAAETDGNPDTVADPNWSSYITTPNHPSYLSGHSSVSGASGAVLAKLFGDNISFTASTEGVSVPDRTFTSFSHASQEAADSRLYGGIHWKYDNEDGLALGRAVGQHVFATQLRPIVPEPGTWILLVLGLVGCLAGRRSGRVS